MEPIAVELLLKLAAGTAGAAGQQAWQSLRALVMRHPAEDRNESPAAADLEALAEEPDSAERARALTAALQIQAVQDPDFAQALESWRQAAESGLGDVHNEISGGVTGPVLMGRDFSGVINVSDPVVEHTSPGPENDPDDDWPQES
ncbi:hypothetical protein [Streptomyces olivochromogenes]|uniref:hypothetical protein n=1 Tax=Streptomyces olivochromogenes TaxID=1963 RepID=UPI001F214AA3|nr:hypothetical protein [Streptomyces olivochromogenes]MCF3136897.1 hypothetical protein [Streptomyces olivochromogenes]